MPGIGSLVNTRINLLAIGHPSLIGEYREPLLQRGSEPNIYMFHKIDKMSFINEDCIVEKEKLVLKIRNKTKNFCLTFDLTKVFEVLYLNEIYFNGKYELLSSGKRIKILLTNDSWFTMDAMDLMTNYQYYNFVQEKEAYFNRGPLLLETIYVGMAYGSDGNRNAFDRISSHSKLQEIISEAYDGQWKEDIVVSLWEMEPSIITGMIGTSDSDNVNKDIEHINKIFNGPLDYKQLVSLTEAGIVYHLQPRYNTKLKKTFPDNKAKSYSEIYFREFDGISIEFGLEDHYVATVSKDIMITEQNSFIETKWLDINDKEFFKKMVNGEIY